MPQSPDVPEAFCACPVPAIIRIKDNVEMVAVLSGNEEAIPVLLRYLVGVQHTSQGHLVIHHCSSTHHTNHHAKQFGYCSYSLLSACDFYDFFQNLYSPHSTLLMFEFSHSQLYDL